LSRTETIIDASAGKGKAVVYQNFPKESLPRAYSSFDEEDADKSAD